MGKTYRDKQHLLVEDEPEGPLAELAEGLIVDGSRGMYRVETELGPLTCTIRGKLRKELIYGESRATSRSVRKVNVKPHDPVAVGDRVRVLPTGHGVGVIEEVVARAGGAFSRRDPDPKQGRLTTVAGLDQMVLVFATRDPEPHLGLLDRFLAVAEAQQTQAIICVTKADLGVPAWLAERLDVYRRLGYPIVWTSIATGQGVDELRALLAGKTSAFLGKSGVGKSSLLNAIEPALEQRVSAISAATGKGRHTTTSTRLFPLGGPSGGYIADTAGIRALGLEREVEADLDHYFREFRPYLGACALADCTHTHEPGCAVYAAARAGEIDAERYDSYCRMRGAASALDAAYDDAG
ncbi:MAG TPA: ribosome small subunit-dependent GTPase A [Ktedonobacterales bacterium]|nr:ribosome small subunit-dependent GTPase A [Ktedonobacterales bacterium]